MSQAADQAEEQEGFLEVEDAEYSLLRTGDAADCWRRLTTAWARNNSFGNSKEYRSPAIKKRNAALEKRLDALLKKNPRQAEAWALRGALPWRKDFPAVKADFDKAEALGLRAPALYTWRGTVRLKMLDREGGKADLLKSLSLPESNAWNYAWAGRALLTQFRDRTGLSYMDKAAELSPKWAKIFAWRAEAKRHLGDLQGMTADYERALRLAPGRGLRDLMRGFHGMGLLALGRDRDAIKELKLALKATPRRTLWHHGLSTAMRRVGNLKAWIEYLDKAARLDLKYENMPGGWPPAERASALADLDSVLEKSPRFAVARRWRAKLLLADGRAAEAAADLQVAAQDEPRRAANWLWLADARRAAGDLDGARAALARAAKLKPRAEELGLAQGRLELDAGNLKAALARYDAALKAEPRHAPARAERGAVLLALGRDKAARRDLELASQLSGRDARSWTDLSLARRRTGDAAGAEAALEKARALDPRTADQRLARWTK